MAKIGKTSRSTVSKKAPAVETKVETSAPAVEDTYVFNNALFMNNPAVGIRYDLMVTEEDLESTKTFTADFEDGIEKKIAWQVLLKTYKKPSDNAQFAFTRLMPTFINKIIAYDIDTFGDMTGEEMVEHLGKNLSWTFHVSRYAQEIRGDMLVLICFGELYAFYNGEAFFVGAESYLEDTRHEVAIGANGIAHTDILSFGKSNVEEYLSRILGVSPEADIMSDEVGNAVVGCTFDMMCNQGSRLLPKRAHVETVLKQWEAIAENVHNTAVQGYVKCIKAQLNNRMRMASLGNKVGKTVTKVTLNTKIVTKSDADIAKLFR